MSAFSELVSLFKSILSFFLQFNFIDVLILLIFGFYILEGYAVGFVASAIDFISFFLSFVLAFKYYSLLASVLTKSFSLSVGFSNALAFLLTAFISEFALSFIFKKAVRAFLPKSLFSNPKFTKINNFLGAVPGFFSSVIIVTFFLTLLVSLPLSPSLKNYIFNSKIGNFLVSNAQGFEKRLNTVFGGAVSDTLNFLTVEPKSNESLSLHFTTNNFSVDSKAEQEMFQMVNKERSSRGIATLTFNNALAEVGRAHCEDMFRRGYFSHYTPEGLSPFDRMDKAGISYSFAGENLALAPNVTTAMQGLMNSPGHKANILSTDFGKVGIGVIDGGVYGEMFCQEFTD